jgi:hypothetical protein
MILTTLKTGYEAKAVKVNTSGEKMRALLRWVHFITRYNSDRLLRDEVHKHRSRERAKLSFLS